MDLSIFNCDINNAYHTYTSGQGKKYLKISNTISSFCLVGTQDGTDTQGMLVKSASLGDNISRIDDKCFYNCTNLSTVHTSEGLKNVGDSAFYGCENLYYVDFLDGDKRDNPIYTIGDMAFAYTGLQDITIHTAGGEIKGQSTDSYVGTGAFQYCTDLQKVSFKKSNHFGDQCFKGCTSLQQVNFVNGYSYEGENAFEECTSLTGITIPRKFHMITDNMFKKCSRLRSVEFEDSEDNPSTVALIGDFAFYGCNNLTSITLPSSISTYTSIRRNAFFGSNLKEIRFNGFTDDMITYQSSKTSSTSATYKTGEWIRSNDKETITQIFNDAIQNGIPMVVQIGNLNGGCGQCKNVETNVYQKQDFKDFQNSSGYYWLDGDKTGNNIGFQTLKTLMKNNFGVTQSQWSNYPSQILLCYVNGEYKILGTICRVSDCNTFISKVKQAFSGITPSSEKGTTVIISPDLSGWGLSNDCVYISKTSNRVTYPGSGQGIVYSKYERTDNYSVSDFRNGQWYSNLKELKNYADTNNFPVFFEIGSKNCGPCNEFRDNVWNNTSFQNWIKQKKILLGHYEYTSEADEKIVFANQNLFNRQSGDQAGPPHLICYGNKGQIKTDKFFGIIGDYSGSRLTSMEDVSSFINTTLTENEGIQPVPAITDFISVKKTKISGRTTDELSDYMSYTQIKMRRYENVLGDDIGRFFVCDTKTLDEDNSYAISTATDTTTWGETTTIKCGQEINGPVYPLKSGTYWYTTMSEDDLFFDKQGIVFKIDYMNRVTDLGLSDSTSISYDTWTVDESKSRGSVEGEDYKSLRVYTNTVTAGSMGISKITVYYREENYEDAFQYRHFQCNNNLGVKYLYKFNNETSYD